MAVTRKAMAITLWCVCGGVLIIVIILTIVFFVLRKRRLQSRKHKGIAYIDNNTTTTANHLHHRHGNEGGAFMFAGFQLQSGVQDLTSVPPSGVYGAAQVVYLQPLAAPPPGQQPCDILLSIQYQPVVDAAWLAPGGSAATGAPQLLGQEAFLHQNYALNAQQQQQQLEGRANFLLYTSPLYFQSAGTYVLLAHTINPFTKVVGTMHQFVYIIDLNGVVQRSAMNRQNTIDIDLSRGNNGALVVAQPPAMTYSTPPQQQLSPPPQPGFVSSISDGRSVGALAVAGSSSGCLLPPRVTPSVGEVTTSTRILIAPTYRQHGVRLEDKILYSTDGSEPNMVYQGPFTLAMHYQQKKASSRGGKGNAQWVTIRAVAVSNNSNNNNTDHNFEENPSTHSRNGSAYILKSPETQVRLRVRPAGYSYYDPAVPSPCATVRTSNASLYFDETGSRQACPSDVNKYVTVYQIIYLKVAQHEAFFDQMREETRGGGGGGGGGKKKRVKLDLRKCIEYKGVPIHISEDIFQVYAWTLERAVFDRKRSNVNTANDSDDEQDPSSVLWRSPACVYDCTQQRARELPSYSIPKAIQKLRERGAVDAATLRPPPSPVMCVSCSEVELIFEDPPANSKIAYTINGKEPALFDVDPPACAAPLRPRKNHGDDDEDEDDSDDAGGTPPATYTPRGRTTVLGDADGKQTYLYHPGKRITLSLLAARAAHLTARVFIPVYEDAQGALHGGTGGQGGSGGTLLGYRYGDVFYRAFYFDSGEGSA